MIVGDLDLERALRDPAYLTRIRRFLFPTPDRAQPGPPPETEGAEASAPLPEAKLKIAAR